MATTVVLVDGIGGNPLITFGGLRDKLVAAGYLVYTPNTSLVRTHEDRIRLALKAYKDEADKGRDVVFVGQSAGGSAVRIAAERINKSGGKKLVGVVLLSPAMPRWIIFLTVTSFLIMLKRLPQILLGGTGTFKSTASELLALVKPMSKECVPDIINHRSEIPCAECRELAFYPPSFIGYTFPTLHVWGTHDRWISPEAQRKLHKMLSVHSPTSAHIVNGAGHVTLMSDRYGETEKVILQWIAALGRPEQELMDD